MSEDEYSLKEGCDLEIRCEINRFMEDISCQWSVKFPNTELVIFHPFTKRSIFIKDCLRNDMGIYSCTVSSCKHKRKFKSMTKKLVIKQDDLKVWSLPISKMQPASGLIRELQSSEHTVDLAMYFECFTSENIKQIREGRETEETPAFTFLRLLRERNYSAGEIIKAMESSNLHKAAERLKQLVPTERIDERFCCSDIQLLDLAR